MSLIDLQGGAITQGREYEGNQRTREGKGFGLEEADL